MNYNETTLLMSAMVMLRGALADISDARVESVEETEDIDEDEVLS